MMPPIDLNKPIENPGLVRAMGRFAHDKSNAAKDELISELQRANYIAAALNDEMNLPPGKSPGAIMSGKESHIKLISSTKDGKNYLPLFTDWAAMKVYTSLNVNALVLPARDAWSLVLQGSAFHGVVINPPHNALPLERNMIEILLRNLKK